MARPLLLWLLLALGTVVTAVESPTEEKSISSPSPIASSEQTPDTGSGPSPSSEQTLDTGSGPSPSSEQSPGTGSGPSPASKPAQSRLLERFIKKLKRVLFGLPRRAQRKPESGSAVSGTCPSFTYKDFLLEAMAAAAASAEDAKTLCEPLALNDSIRGHVQLLNHTQLIVINVRDKKRFERSSSIMSNTALGENGTSTKVAHCVMMLVYAHFCPFSKGLAPMYVALAKAFPQIAFYAIHIHDYKKVKSAMSAIGVPKLFFLRKGKTVSIYNHSSKSFASLKAYVHNMTGFEAVENVTVTANISDADFGPFTFNTDEFDVYLLFSWTFLLALLGNYVLRSSHG